jgi:O-antigen/teichoic acid export membrane protein
MPRHKRFAFNVIMNWVAMAVGMAVPFFLTPIVVHHLGSTGYGIWILAVSTVSYLTLLDLGLRSAIIRFVSKADAQGNLEEAQKAIQATLWFRLLVAAGITVLSIALAALFPYLFKLPPDLQRAAQITVLMCSLGVAVSMISGVFGAVLNAIQRFDVLSTIGIFQVVARAGGVVLILLTGHGLTTLAYWELTVAVLSGVAFGGAALRLYPPCRVRIGLPDFATLKMIWSYSFLMFIIIIASQVIFNSDNMVVGGFLSVGLVAYYSIGGSLTVYSGQIVSGLSTTFTPMASGFEASGKMEELRQLLMRGTQAVLALALPISLALLFRGKTFIGLWMGPRYSHVSGTVLQILLIGQFFTVADVTAGNIMFAIGRHKAVAKAASIEAALNLGLSILLVKTIGIYGVAWGTSISMSIIHLIFWPRYVRKILGIPVLQYLWEGWGKITLCSLPYAAVCAVADRHWHPASLAIFFAQIMVVLPVYFVSVLLVFRKEAKELFHKWWQSRLVRATA